MYKSSNWKDYVNPSDKIYSINYMVLNDIYNKGLDSGNLVVKKSNSIYILYCESFESQQKLLNSNFDNFKLRNLQPKIFETQYFDLI
jgi:hypothetical protein